ncbi:MAG: GWxTD domain-containing protein [Candidatus Aminicenantales bacterium]
MKKQKIGVLALALIAGLIVSVSCRLYNLERKLDPVNAEFLNTVKYIITSEERKTFLELPDSEKPQFIEEFWKRRDLDPDTEENEFKMEYFNRIEKANATYLGEGVPGWLTDRGRIFIIFGPPTDRFTQPMSGDPYSRCSEVWYYGDFPVVFYDSTCTGSYKLVTYDLTPIRRLDISYMQENILADSQKTSKEGRRLFDLNVKINKSREETGKISGEVLLEIPYDRIWFKADGSRMETTLDVELSLKDVQGQIVWERKDSFEVKFEEAELQSKIGQSHILEIPFLIDQESQLNRLALGKNMLHVLLKNRTGNETLRKAMEFK